MGPSLIGRKHITSGKCLSGICPKIAAAVLQPKLKIKFCTTKRRFKLYELPFAFGIFGLYGGGLIVFVVSFLLMLDDVFKGGGKNKE